MDDLFEKQRYLDLKRCATCGHFESSHGWSRWLGRFACLIWGCRCRA